ncbi:hypothetical protein HDZ31DRAFT_69235 [Schizophyllum fasciatum]
MTREILAYENRDPALHQYDRPARDDAVYLGGWMNLAPSHWLRFYLAAGYPVYLLYPSERNALAPIDERTIVSNSWNPFIAAAKEEQLRWQATTQWTRDDETPFAPRTRDSRREEDRAARPRNDYADPRRYGYRLGGEETPGASSSTAQERDVEMRPATPLEDAMPPPPDYTTVERGSAYVIEDDDGYSYRVPAEGSSAYSYQLDRVTIDPSRADWIRPPTMPELGPSSPRSRMAAFVPTEVEINGQWRTVYRQIGRSNPARNRYHLMQDRVNRRNIYVPRSYRPPPGTVDADVWGMPAPNALYFGVPVGREPAPARRPSIWMYPAEPAESRRLARPGSRPAPPNPRDLPPLQQAAASPIQRVQEDLYLQSDGSEDDEDIANEFYAGPAGDDEVRERSVSPLPLYSREASETGRPHTTTQTTVSTSATQTAVSTTTSRTTIPAPARQPASIASAPLLPQRGNPDLIPADVPRIQSLAELLLLEVSRGAQLGTESPMDVEPRQSLVTEAPVATPIVAEGEAPVTTTAAAAGEGASETRTASASGASVTPAIAASPSPATSAPPPSATTAPSTSAAEDVVSEAETSTGPPEAGGWRALPSGNDGSETAFLRVRNLLRWVRAPDLERALHRVMASTGFPRPRILSVYGRDQDERPGPFSLYIEFQTVGDAVRFRRAMGAVWMVQATYGSGLPRPNGQFRARLIDYLTRAEFLHAATSPTAWLYPWQTLLSPGTSVVMQASALGQPAATAATGSSAQFSAPTPLAARIQGAPPPLTLAERLGEPTSDEAAARRVHNRRRRRYSPPSSRPGPSRRLDGAPIAFASP